MECKKCGAVNPEGVTFCQVCGARVDGKKKCKHCGKLIDEEAVYCGYCGWRADGKTVCPECGAAAEGDFCPHCGARVKKETNGKPTQPCDGNKELSSYNKVVKYLAPSLTLAAILILFICSFFINLTVKTTGSADSVLGGLSGETEGGVFYFFGDCYSVLNEMFEEGIPSGILLGYILTTVAVVLNFAVGVTMLSVATVKFVKGVNKNESVNLTPFFGWAFGAFVFAACMIGGIYGIYAYKFSAASTYVSAESAKIVLSGFTVACIIVSVLFVASSTVLQAVCEGKKFLSYNRLGKCVALAVGLVLGATVLSIARENALKLSMKQISGRTNSSVSASLPAWATLVRELASGASVRLGEELYFFGTLSYGLLAVAVSLYIAFAFGSLGKGKGCAGACVTSTLCGLAGLLHLIGAMLIQSDFANVILRTAEGVSVSVGGSVGIMVLCAFVVASGIIAMIYSKKTARTGK